MRLSTTLKKDGSSRVRLGLSAGEANALGLLSENASRRFDVQRHGNKLVLLRVPKLPANKSPKHTGCFTLTPNLPSRNPGHHPGFSMYFPPQLIGYPVGVVTDAQEVPNRISTNGVEIFLPPGIMHAIENAATLAQQPVPKPRRVKTTTKVLNPSAAPKVKASHISSRIREGVNINALAAALKKLNRIVGGKEEAVKLAVNERGLVEAEIVHRRVIGGFMPRR
jgi:hypothetical protein